MLILDYTVLMSKIVRYLNVERIIKIMKKKLALVLCCGLVALSLMTGCSKKEDVPKEDTKVESASESDEKSESVEEVETETEKKVLLSANGDPIVDVHETNEWGYSVSMIASVLELDSVGIASDASMDVAEMILNTMYEMYGVYGIDAFSVVPEKENQFYGMSMDGILYVIITEPMGDGLSINSIREATTEEYISLGYYVESVNGVDDMAEETEAEVTEPETVSNTEVNE